MFNSYLFVGLSEQNAHALHWQADVTQRAGVAAEARGSVNALHSREAGVKLALQKRRTWALLKQQKCTCSSQGFSLKVSGPGDLFANEREEEKKRLKGPALWNEPVQTEKHTHLLVLMFRRFTNCYLFPALLPPCHVWALEVSSDPMPLIDGPSDSFCLHLLLKVPQYGQKSYNEF